MKVLIIEDERPAYLRLHKLIEEVKPGFEIIAHLDSVQSTRDWLSANAHPDLIFLDIHLGDGSGFDLLNSVNIACPVIFVTAFDQYAIAAFKTNSIDYLLKPVKKDDLLHSLSKLEKIKDFFSTKDSNFTPQLTKDYKKRFVIRFGEHIKTLMTDDVAYFYSENKATFAKTTDARTYPMDSNLDTLEGLLNPDDFFRINRQYLISLKAIDDMKTYSKARVIVTLKPSVKEPPVVSSERSADFKQWLAGELK